MLRKANENLKAKNIGKIDERTTEEKINAKEKSAKYFYLKKSNFWDSTPEKNIYDNVKSILPKEYILIPHVGLRELFIVKENGNKESQKGNYKYLCTFHVDMVIFDKEYMTPLMEIEVDGKDHEREPQIVSDSFKNELFKHNHLPLLRINNLEISNKTIYMNILKKFDEYKLCKICGAPMRLIEGPYGEFYGCSKYNSDGTGCNNKRGIRMQWL